MYRRAAPHVQIGHDAVPAQGQAVSRRRWWHTLLPCRGDGRISEVEHSGQAERLEPLSLEEGRILQRYHARNLAAARRATEDLVREGWHTGCIPYGYQPQRIRIAPIGRRPRYRTRLMIEPVEASIVKMIFLWRVHDGLSLDEIVHRLNGARYPTPIRPGASEPAEWASPVVRAILGNPKYTGYQVWGRTHHGYPTPSEQWVWSGHWAHPPVIDLETFMAAQQLSPHPPRIPARDGRLGQAA